MTKGKSFTLIRKICVAKNIALFTLNVILLIITIYITLYNNLYEHLYIQGAREKSMPSFAFNILATIDI